MNKGQEHFQQVETMFGQFMNTAAASLSLSQLAEIQEFIDFSEYGLALETAVDIYVEDKIKVPADVLTLIGRLADLMEMDRNGMTSRLIDDKDSP